MSLQQRLQLFLIENEDKTNFHSSLLKFIEEEKQLSIKNVLREIEAPEGVKQHYNIEIKPLSKEDLKKCISKGKKIIDEANKIRLEESIEECKEKYDKRTNA